MEPGASEGEKYRELSPSEFSAVSSYFHDLGITYNNLRDRDILDIGAGDADFASAMSTQDGRVTSVDIIKGGYGRNGEVPAGIPYVVADFKKGVPLPDASFDLLVARASLHAMVKSEEDFLAVTREATRLLRPGGEFRFTPVEDFNALSGEERDRFSTVENRIVDGEEITEGDEALLEKAWPDYFRSPGGTSFLGLSPEERKARFLEKRREDIRRLLPGVTITPIKREINTHEGEKIVDAEYYVYTKPAEIGNEKVPVTLPEPGVRGEI